ncbi:MAG: hypothetical protein ACPGWR_20740 [Ardenticatenaceae bacterium]
MNEKDSHALLSRRRVLSGGYGRVSVVSIGIYSDEDHKPFAY